MAGLAARLPRTATFFVITMLAMAGLPLLNGFVGEFLILSSTFTGVSKGMGDCRHGHRDSRRGIRALAGAATLLRPRKPHDREPAGHDLRINEWVALVPLAVLMLIMGIAPTYWTPRDRATTRNRASLIAIPIRPGTSDLASVIVLRVGGQAMNPVDSLRILPEIVLTLTGILVMLIDASLAVGWPRRSLGWVAALGTTRRLSSIWQLTLAWAQAFLRHRRDQPLHCLLPRTDLRHRAGRAAVSSIRCPKTAITRASTTR